jgi:hypothetical protein
MPALPIIWFILREKKRQHNVKTRSADNAPYEMKNPSSRDWWETYSCCMLGLESICWAMLINPVYEGE